VPDFNRLFAGSVRLVRQSGAAVGIRKIVAGTAKTKITAILGDIEIDWVDEGGFQRFDCEQGDRISWTEWFSPSRCADWNKPSSIRGLQSAQCGCMVSIGFGMATAL
jgi:hypothetical protein